jgi:hypothetical protein
MVGHFDRGPENRHDRIANVLVDNSARRFHSTGHCGEIGIELFDQILRRLRLTVRSEISQIGEQDSNLSNLAAQFDLRAHQFARDLRRDRLAQQVAHLVPFFEPDRHPVERGGQITKFIPCLNRHAHTVITFIDALDAL